MFELERRDRVYVLHMTAGDNRIHRDFVDRCNAALDDIASDDAPSALVTTGRGKFYSNGLDLEWLSTAGDGEAGTFVADLHKLFARILAFPAVTVAAVNGHAFAAGAMLTLAHDFRVMRNDRGFWCLPEVDLGIPFRPGMMALIKARLPKNAFHDALVTGRRFAAAEAVTAGIVHDSAGEEEVLERAVEFAAANIKQNRDTLVEIKRSMYEDALRVLESGA